jgi:flagellar biosynthesis protein FliQ
MTETTVLELANNTLMMTLLLSLPVLGVSLVVGIVIGILQAATQIHESTITFVPKILVLFLVLALLGPWMLHNMVGFTSDLFAKLPALAH